jgi:CobQ-like glutamine amidotransferase family enzyme
MKQKLIIGWLYPQLMNTYGDRGNIIVLTKRAQWRDIDTEVKYLNEGYAMKDLQSCDLLFMGGAQDTQQKIVAQDLKKDKVKALSEMIHGDIPGLYICGAYQFLGNYYKEADGTIINGLGIFDLYTENPGADVKRLIGNISVDFKDEKHFTHTLVGFENHGGRTYLGKNIQPMARVVTGFGNNGTDKTEGAVYKSSYGSYMHGPVLPKNPFFADSLIQKALEKKYKEAIELKKLNDKLENQAHDFILEKVMK